MSLLGYIVYAFNICTAKIAFFFDRMLIKTVLFCKDNLVKKRQFRFGVAKAALLQRKTYAFTVQKSRFWNVKQ